MLRVWKYLCGLPVWHTCINVAQFLIVLSRQQQKYIEMFDYKNLNSNNSNNFNNSRSRNNNNNNTIKRCCFAFFLAELRENTDSWQTSDRAFVGRCQRTDRSIFSWKIEKNGKTKSCKSHNDNCCYITLLWNGHDSKSLDDSMLAFLTSSN